LDMKYFFDTDKIKKGEVEVAFCPTHDMLGDFFTKPLQGNQFMRMRDKIINLPSSTCIAMHRSVSEKANFKKSVKQSSAGPNRIEKTE